jgi:ABC-2 type transport system ATP-binding protein
MAETRVRRQAQVVPTDDGSVRLPADIADLLGEEVEIQVGPGKVVTLQPAAAPVLPVPQAAVRPVQPAGTAVLEVRNLSVMYGTFKAVDDVSFQVGRGEIFGLLGPNGAGKTSTLSAIEGLLKPRGGSVVLDGFDVQRDPIEAKARMGVQLQATSFQSQLTIRQIVRLYAGLYGVVISDADIDAQLDVVGLAAEAAKPFKHLSGGQQQRLSLFIAVIHDPALLLLDEPTAGLDPQARRQLWSRIEDIRKKGGSIMLTTHSMEEAQAVCDRVAIIDHGKLLTAETPQDLIAKHKDDPRVRAVAHGNVTLEDVFIGLTGSEVRD